jgi:hypothetical protein
MPRPLVILTIIALSSSVVIADLNLKPIHPDESSQYTFEKRFSIDNALMSLSKIEESLDSFRDLTDKIRSNKAVNISKVENTDWETQNIGFPNMTNAIEGTLLKQDYLINKLQYELIMEQKKTTHISDEEITKKLNKLRESETKFQNFWNSKTISD